MTLAQVVQALRNDQLPLDLPLPDSHPIPSPRQLETADAYLGVLQELEDMRELLRAPDLPARPRAAGQNPGPCQIQKLSNILSKLSARRSET